MDNDNVQKGTPADLPGMVLSLSKLDKNLEFPIGLAVWVDPNKATHWAVGAVLVRQHPRETFCMWDACGHHDISPSGAHYYREGIDVVDCPECLGKVGAHG